MAQQPNSEEHHELALEHKQHEAIARWERRWLNIAGLLLAMFVILIAYSLATQGAQIAQRSGRTTPEKLTSLELFANPGVEITDFGAGRPTKARVTVVAQAWSFNPAEIVLPAGAVTTFYLTSRDVLHGFQVEGTDINVELIPGEISTLSYTFDKPGVYRTTCNEYCGFGHQNMLGVVRVVAPGELAQESARAAAAAPSGTEAADDVGESVYTTNCVSCHQANGQGVAGAFPPLAGHAVKLFQAERSYLPKLLLNGLEGQISVGGNAYNGQMPAWAQLSDEELAGTLNYVLNSWGNGAELPDFEPYTAEEIAPFRDETLSAQDIYKLRQTLKLND